MNILHIKNTAGVATQLRNAQRNLGYNSDIMVFDAGQKNYDYDYIYPNKRTEEIPIPLVNKGVQLIENIFQFNNLIREYDVLHFHSYTIVGANVAPRFPPQGLDLPLWKLKDKQIIKHHHGSDIRYRGCPFFQRKFTDLRLVSTPDLLNWDAEAKLILNPIFSKEYEYVGVEPRSADESITVVHAPTSDKKGTEDLKTAISELQEDGYDIDLEVVRNTPNEEALEIYKNADVIADQFNLGWYGMFTIEGMALGKPVLVYIDNEHKEHAPELPVVETSTDEIKENLASLAMDFERRQILGRRGRKFVETHHDAVSIAENILEQLE